MGYRSEVGYVIAFQNNIDWTDEASDKDKTMTGRDVFNTFLAEAKSNPETKQCFEDIDADTYIVNETEMYIKGHWSDVKWYDDYDDVKCHHKLMEMASEYINSQRDNTNIKFTTISYGFVRIGEENDDIETEYDGDEGWDLVYPVRKIDFNV